MAFSSLRAALLCCAVFALSLLQGTDAWCLNPLNSCQQVAVWVETSNPDCLTAAGNAMLELVKPNGGRDGFRIESTGEGGGWLRFWRIPLSPTGINWFTMASGTCVDGSSWHVLESSIQPNRCHVKC